MRQGKIIDGAITGLVICILLTSHSAFAQFGGGMGGGNQPAPPGLEKPKFREHMMQRGSLRVQREKGDKIVAGVRVEGNRAVGIDRIMEHVQTRQGRVYDYNLVLEDVRRLTTFGAFGQIKPDIKESPEGVYVTFIVQERPIVQTVEFHGNRGINDRELKGRVGVERGDPLNQFSIESGRTRLVGYYQEKGFNQATVETVVGKPGYPNAIVYRINEGPLERIDDIRITGNRFVGTARLKKIIKSRELAVGMFNIGNTAKMDVIAADVDRLTSYYRDLGFFEAEVGLAKSYDASGKYLTLNFVVKEGARYFVRNVELVGLKFVDKQSLSQRLRLKQGDPFDRGKLEADIKELQYALGSLGFIFADVQARPTVLDQPGQLDLVFRVAEGDQYRCGEIRIHVDGDDHLIAQEVIIPRLEFREGDLLDRKKIDRSELILKSTQVFTTNPAEGPPPRIEVSRPRIVDVEEAYGAP